MASAKPVGKAQKALFDYLKRHVGVAKKLDDLEYTLRLSAKELQKAAVELSKKKMITYHKPSQRVWMEKDVIVRTTTMEERVVDAVSTLKGMRVGQSVSLSSGTGGLFKVSGGSVAVGKGVYYSLPGQFKHMIWSFGKVANSDEMRQEYNDEFSPKIKAHKRPSAAVKRALGMTRSASVCGGKMASEKMIARGLLKLAGELVAGKPGVSGNVLYSDRGNIMLYPLAVEGVDDPELTLYSSKLKSALKRHRRVLEEAGFSPGKLKLGTIGRNMVVFEIPHDAMDLAEADAVLGDVLERIRL